MKIWGFLGNFQWDVHNAMAMALWKNSHHRRAKTSGGRVAKRCWIPRCCGVFLLSHQRLEPRSRSGSDAITLRAKSMNKLNRLSLVTGRTLYFSCYLFETLRSSKKTSMFTASLLYRLKKMFKWTDSKYTTAAQWLWCPPCTTESVFRCSTCTYQIMPSTAGAALQLCSELFEDMSFMSWIEVQRWSKDNHSQ